MIRDVGVGQLVEELEQRGDRLPFEIGAFVALEACEGLLQESVKLEPDDVRVTLEGSVVVAGSAESAEPDEAARSLVSVLARLLVAAGPGVPPYLLDLVKESVSGEPQRGLRDLHDAIEASLIPINRGASRRVLARLVRESDRPPAPPSSQVDPHELDAELEELLRDPVLRTQGPEEEPTTERIRIPRGVREEQRQSTDTAADTDTDTAAGTAPAAAAAAAADTAPAAVADTAPAADTAPVPDPAPKSFPPPVPDPPETVPVAPSEPARLGGSVPIPDLGSPAAAAVAEPRRQVPEPITATIRKWSREEDAEHPPRDSAPADQVATEPVSVSTTVSVAEPDPGASPVATKSLYGESGLETPTESAFGAGSVAASEPIPSPELPVERPSRSSAAPGPTYDRPSIPQQPRKRRGGWGIWLLAAGLGLGAYALIATGTLDSLRQPAAPAPAPAVGGTIDVTVSPSDAQIFVFIGRGPAAADGLPIDAAHEFVVFDEGLEPSRAIVAKGATWATTDSGPLYELAVQARPASTAASSGDLGAPQTAPTSASDRASGTIRVITNPPAAKVYRFVGLGPTVRIPVASIHEGQELLVFRAGHETRRAVIGPSDWQKAPGSAEHGASLTIKLPALPGSASAETIED